MTFSLRNPPESNVNRPRNLELRGRELYFFPSNYFSVHFILALFFVSENLSLDEASGSLLRFKFFYSVLQLHKLTLKETECLAQGQTELVVKPGIELNYSIFLVCFCFFKQ